MKNDSYIIIHFSFNNLSLVAEVVDKRIVLSYHSLTVIILREYTCIECWLGCYIIIFAVLNVYDIVRSSLIIK